MELPQGLPKSQIPRHCANCRGGTFHCGGVAGTGQPYISQDIGRQVERKQFARGGLYIWVWRDDLGPGIARKQARGNRVRP